MKRISVILGLVLALLAAPAWAQLFRHELSFFGTRDNVDEPVDIDTTIVNLRYGHFFTEQVVGTVGLQHSSFKGPSIDISSTALTLGAKFYFGPQRREAFTPFLDASVGLANTDAPGGDDTDLTWELGGGASYFITDATSVDLALRWYQTDTSVESEGLRIFLGVSTRF